MEDSATDYKVLYEQSLLTLAQNVERIAGLEFELDKFRCIHWNSTCGTGKWAGSSGRCCRRKNGVNEFEWLKDVFERIQSHKQKDIYQLLPNNWKEYRLKKD